MGKRANKPLERANKIEKGANKSLKRANKVGEKSK